MTDTVEATAREPVLIINRGDYADLWDALHHTDAEIAKKATTPLIGDSAQERHEKRLKGILGEDTFEEASGITPRVDINPEADEPRLEWRPPR